MKTSAPSLYPNATVAERVTTYSEEHSLALPPHIPTYHAHIIDTHPRSNYMISNFQAQAHVFLARTIGAKRILEIGVYVGYSAMAWSHAVGPGGSVVGLEFSKEYAEMARKALGQNGVANVEILEGDALQTLPNLASEEPFDLIFIDAQKSGYPTYLRTILDLSRPGAGQGRILRPGGLIIADNVLRRGIVADPSDDNPNAVKAKSTNAHKSEYEADTDLDSLRKYNDDVAKSERLESWLMPLYDGVNLARLLD